MPFFDQTLTNTTGLVNGVRWLIYTVSLE